MIPHRIASILMFLWTIIQVWFLEAIGIDMLGHPAPWLLCVAVAGVSAGLWFVKPWAKLSGLVVATGFIMFYLGALYFRSGTGCVDGSIQCYARTFSQPLLMAITLAVLIWSLASNNRIERSRDA